MALELWVFDITIDTSAGTMVFTVGAIDVNMAVDRVKVLAEALQPGASWTSFKTQRRGRLSMALTRAQITELKVELGFGT